MRHVGGSGPRDRSHSPRSRMRREIEAILHDPECDDGLVDVQRPGFLRSDLPLEGPGPVRGRERRPVRIAGDATQVRGCCRVEHVIRCSSHEHLPFTGMDGLWALTHDRDDNAKAGLSGPVARTKKRPGHARSSLLPDTCEGHPVNKRERLTPPHPTTSMVSRADRHRDPMPKHKRQVLPIERAASEVLHPALRPAQERLVVLLDTLCGQT
jgi:hypothetical protein